MSILGSPYFGVAVGVFASIFIHCVSVKNPAQIPARQIWFRAFFGVSLFFLIWTAVVVLVLGVMARWTKFSELGPLSTWIAGFVIGVGVPLLRVPEAAVTRRRFSGPLRFITVQLVALTEVTRNYVEKIIAREERKVADDILKGKVITAPDIVLDRLYERHKVQIVQQRMASESAARRPDAFSLLFTKARSVKCQLLGRHLGVVRLVSGLQEHAPNVGQLFPTWPASEGCRRKRRRRQRTLPYKADRRTQYPYGRRHTDPPALMAELQSSGGG
jgi:hypothetical protein